MRFLTDENVATSVVQALRKAGYDVFDVKEQGWFGKTDKSLASFASKEQRVILTHDKDFLYQRVVTVVLLRFSNQKPINVIHHLIFFLKTPGLPKKINEPVIIILSESVVELYK